VTRPGTIGFGKKYPDFWLNERRAMTPAERDSGTHICLRASSIEAVQGGFMPRRWLAAAHRTAPGASAGIQRRLLRAFVRDPEGNKIEAVTFTAGGR
jgi:catechol 2,3-dioxygenase-like lactoylglutathione lyase family enzyme